MPELTVLVSRVAVYLCVYTTNFPWRLLLFTMGITGKQEVMQRCTMVLYLKMEFWSNQRGNPNGDPVPPCSPACLYAFMTFTDSTQGDQHHIQTTSSAGGAHLKVPCGGFTKTHCVYP